MRSIAIRGLPDDIHRELKKAARLQGKSLNDHVVTLLKAGVGESRRRRAMRERWPEFQKFIRSLPPVSDSTPLIRQDRDREH
jgi:hypothetical protein